MISVTMVSPEQTLEDEIAAKCNQACAAATYAWAMRNARSGESVDWRRINTAIMARWPKGLARVKEAAHRWYREHFGEEPVS